MTGILAISFLAVAVRIAGSPIRSSDRPFLLRAIGWMLCTVGIWLALAAADALSPLWPALAIGLIASIADTKPKERTLKILADITVLTVTAALSIPVLPWNFAGLVIILLATGAALIDSVVKRMPSRFHVPLIIAPFIGGLLLLAVRFQQCRDIITILNTHLPQIAVATIVSGQPVTLETKAIAYIERPHTPTPRPGAIFFHGANPDGVRQPAAAIVRRALLMAGYVVVSVEHPGYGQIPHPSIDAPVEAWDPLPTGLAALSLLRDENITSVTAIGHSLGCMDVLRLVTADAATDSVIDRAVLMGAGMSDGDDRDEYWYRRFHKDRRMKDRLPMDTYRAIIERFYTRQTAALALPDDHAPIDYLVFEHDHADLARTRTALFDLISPPRRWLQLDDSGHYFNAFDFGPILIADTRIARNLSHLFKRMIPE